MKWIYNAMAFFRTMVALSWKRRGIALLFGAASLTGAALAAWQAGFRPAIFILFVSMVGQTPELAVFIVGACLISLISSLATRRIAPTRRWFGGAAVLAAIGAFGFAATLSAECLYFRAKLEASLAHPEEQAEDIEVIGANPVVALYQIRHVTGWGIPGATFLFIVDRRSTSPLTCYNGATLHYSLRLGDFGFASVFDADSGCNPEPS